MLTIVKVDGRELLRDHHNLGCILTEIRTALLLRATAVSTGVMLECWIPTTYLWFVGREIKLSTVFLGECAKHPSRFEPTGCDGEFHANS